MRRWSLPLACLAALLLPPVVAAQAPAPLAFEDPGGDVERAGAPYSGAHAGAVDVLAASMAETDAGLRFRLALADLSEYAALLPAAQDFVTQYALTFEREDGAAFSLRADYAGLVYGTNPLGRWRFLLHDQRADEWRPADGRVDGNTLEWNVPAAEFGLAAGDDLKAWSVQVWWSDDKGSEQVNDWAQAALTYRLGHGVLVPGPEGPLTAACALEGAWVALVDDPGDVAVGDRPYAGPGAASADVLHACVAEAGDDLLFELALADLGGIQEELAEPGFHAQYALSFRARDGHAGHSMRALFAGEAYTQAAGGAWRFQVHDQQTDAWPEADGARQGDALLWRVPRADLGVDAADRLAAWGVQTWNSYERRDQHGDWAQGDGAYAVGAQEPRRAPGVAAPALQAFQAGGAGDAAEAPFPGALLALLATVGAAAGRSLVRQERRRKRAP